MRNLSYQTRRRIVQVRRVARWWPWLVSAAVHLVVLGILSAVVLVSYNTKAERPEIIPEARLGRVTPGLPVFHRLKPAGAGSAETALEKNLQRQLALPGPGTAAFAAAAGAAGKDPFQAIGVPSTGTGDAFLAGSGVTSGVSSGLPGGDLARLQPAAPLTRFFNTGGNAYNVIYLVDRSASMTDSIEPLKRELKRSIKDLQAMQKFHVIFFSTGKPVEGPGGDLTWATDRNKERYYRFLETIRAEGQTDPQWALQRALQMAPDLIYLLTDGIFPDAIADNIIRWGKLHKVKINTIAYVWESGGSILRRISEQTGGVYRFVSEEQLQ